MDIKHRLYQAIKESHNIVFFGGAGVSTESGIPDFRGTKGVFKTLPEEVLHRDFFWKDPASFYRFYKEYLVFPDIKPNITHRILAQWEKEGKLLSVITQNIDGLHQQGGSKKVWELHGSVHRNFCTQCHQSFSLEQLLVLLDQDPIPLCPCGGVIKPDVVLYGESLNSSVVQGAVQALQKADLCIVGGTSLSVYPAAGFLREFYPRDALFVINQEDLSEKVSSMRGHFIRSSLGEFFQNFPV